LRKPAATNRCDVVIGWVDFCGTITEPRRESTAWRSRPASPTRVTHRARAELNAQSDSNEHPANMGYKLQPRDSGSLLAGTLPIAIPSRLRLSGGGQKRRPTNQHSGGGGSSRNDHPGVSPCRSFTCRGGSISSERALAAPGLCHRFLNKVHQTKRRQRCRNDDVA
jgi:hypothetical protein